MAVELTKAQAAAHPENFLYQWASDQFLASIEPKYANIITVKRANQKLVIMRSVEKYGSSYSEYISAIKSAFESAYGITPERALFKLALGETVAGKNWKEGVYGIGSLQSGFAGSDVTVDKQTGYMEVNGKMVNSTEQIYDTSKGSETGLYQQVYKDSTTGKTYVSQYNKITKKWYAQSYSDANGNMFNANGGTYGSSNMATVWEGVGLALSAFLNWLLSLFGVNTNTEMLSDKNTLPNQQNDGFVYKSGFGEAGAILLLLAAGGVALSGGLIGGGDKKKKKGNK